MEIDKEDVNKQLEEFQMNIKKENSNLHKPRHNNTYGIKKYNIPIKLEFK